MPRSSGTYSLPSGNPVVTGTTISSTWANNTLADMSSALTQSISQDGQTPITGNLPMTGFKHINVGLAVNLTDYARADQVQNSSMQLMTVTGNDTILGTVTAPSMTAYATGQTFRFIAAGTNITNAVTLNINSIGAKNITSNGTTALALGELVINTAYEIYYDGTQFQLINSKISSDSRPLIKGTADITRLLAINLDTNIPTGTTRTVNAQSVSGTIGLVENQIQPVTASVAANALTCTLSPTSLAFRSSTLGAGTVNVRAVNSALSLVVPSGATLGTVNGVQSRLVVLAMDNAGVVELAVVNLVGGNDLTETGVISTTAISASATANNVIYSTTARTNISYRVVGFIDSTQATAGTWATAPSTIQGMGGNAYTAIPSFGMVRLNTANGYGSTNTVIPRFTNIVTNQGADITYADSAANGATFTINTNGVYAITQSSGTTSTSDNGISLNSSQLTTSIANINASDRLCYATSQAANITLTSWTGYLATGSTIRPHNQGSAQALVADWNFTIARVA